MAIFDFNDIEPAGISARPAGRTLRQEHHHAGALSVTTKLQGYTFGGSAEITVGNYNDQQYLATVTGPLVENVLAGAPQSA